MSKDGSKHLIGSTSNSVQYCSIKYIFGFTDLVCPNEVPKRKQKASAFFVRSFVALIKICLIKYCSGYLFGSSHLGRKVFLYLKSKTSFDWQKRGYSSFISIRVPVDWCLSKIWIFFQ